jgi:phosphotransferase family enzyme
MTGRTRTRRRLTTARAVVPAILARQAEWLPDGDGALRATSAEVTSTGMAVVVAGRPGEPPSAVIKLPTTPRAADGLRRETEVLAALRGDDRLGAWRDLIPRPLADGTADGRPYRVDAALPGAPPSRTGDAEHERLREAAAETIHVLHATTAQDRLGDAALAERWVDAPLDALWPRPPRPRWLRSRRDRLRDELHGAILGQGLVTGWVHGDFWLGNLLVSRDTGEIRGIVDWDAAARDELASHDVMHLSLYTERMATGRELGQIVRDRLRAGDPDRPALLLYWLRQVGAHARQQAGRSAPRYLVWERRNVHRVLAAL